MRKIILLFLIVSSNGKLQAQKFDTIVYKKIQLGMIDDTALINEIKINVAKKEKYYVIQDSVIINPEDKYPNVYSKENINAIVDAFPDFYSDETNHPDVCYYSRHTGQKNISDDSILQISFNSEVGQDSYYLLYAYFLKHRNGVKEFADKRKKLIEIYRGINAIFRQLQRGGTYFGHQYYRCEGVAEYAIYSYKSYSKEYFNVSDISKQKQLYLASLKQIIIDRTNKDGDIFPSAKDKTIQKISRTIDVLNNLISDNFFLKMAQQFQYDYY